jgi:hypothetical protein
MTQALLSLMSQYIAHHPNDLHAARVVTRLRNELSLSEDQRRWLSEIIDNNLAEQPLASDCRNELDALASKQRSAS